GEDTGIETEAPSAADTALQEAHRQRDEYLDQLQRTRAEFVNYQKRARAQAEADRLYAIAPMATDLLAVLDNFERAAEAARSAGPILMSGGACGTRHWIRGRRVPHAPQDCDLCGENFLCRNEAIICRPTIIFATTVGTNSRHSSRSRPTPRPSARSVGRPSS